MAAQVRDRNGCRAVLQGGRPDAFEKVAHLLDLGHRLDDQPLPAGTQVPQPAPGLLDRLGHVAAQLGGEPGDQDRVLVVGLVEGQVLATTGPRGLHRLHAYERHRPVRGQLAQHPPPVTGRLTRDRDPGEPLRLSALGRPVQRHPQIPGPAAKGPPGQHFRVVVGDHHHLLLVGQVDADDRVLQWHQLA
ncbi:hypothetical protein ABN028_12805 [Actinopolymorpha sp. B17G11]|uniref:hypothetical protein n=1 Tax=Actinopolymorpha sp. B17G11 TaxID=3160861 RepID=UPI0032E3D0AD